MCEGAHFFTGGDVYFSSPLAWNMWKERNRRVFDHQATSPLELLQAIENEILEKKMACGGPELPFIGGGVRNKSSPGLNS